MAQFFRIQRMAFTLTAILCIHASSVKAQVIGWPRQTGGIVSSSPTIADLDGDGQKEIVLIGNDNNLYIYNWDGSDFSINGNSFPRHFGLVDGSLASPSVGDVTGDGYPDIVIAGDDKKSLAPKLYVYNLQNLTTTTIALGNANASMKGSVVLANCQGFRNTVSHPADEMILRDGYGRIYVYERNGSQFSLLQTWETVTDSSYRDINGSLPITSSVSVVDWSWSSTATSHLILASSSDGKLYYGQVTSTNENNSSDWQAPSSLSSITIGGQLIASPVAANLDGNPDLEVVVGSTNKTITIVRINSSLEASIYKTISTGGWVVSSAAIGQLDDDSDLEIVVGCDDNKVYAFNPDGTALPGWPKETQGDIFASPVLAEVNRELGLEIFVTSMDQRIHAWQRNGLGVWETLAGWPKRLDSPIFATPAIDDLNGNGRVSMVVPSFNGLVTCWDLPRISLMQSTAWPQFRGNEKLTGSR